MRNTVLSLVALAGLVTPLMAQDSTTAASPSTRAPAANPSAPPATSPSVAQPTPSAALGLYVFPAKGQTGDQQKQDESACYAWAHEQSGIDPATVNTNPDSAKKAAAAKVDSAAAGAGIKGAAAGAAGGAVVGAIAGDAGEGAGIGAVAGAAKGRRAKKQAKKQAEQQAVQQANAQASGQIDTFKKAYSACIEGKGYTIK
jgi:outer membrane protein with glycine zipper